jgi:hypothetical protein
MNYKEIRRNNNAWEKTGPTDPRVVVKEYVCV